ncbi:MAG TPA: ubiquitin-like small modifier protein 1 [Anaerolineae bacterium]|nr:ubiquitin-like small modifier protein 1 [Anaerolineae bacterium]
MKVNFFATYRPIVGGKTVEFDVNHGITVNQLVDAIITRFPAMQREMLDANGQLYSHVHIFVNGRDACYLENKLETVIQTDDVLNIFPPVGGG